MEFSKPQKEIKLEKVKRKSPVDDDDQVDDVKKDNTKKSKNWLVFLILGLVGIAGGVACLMVVLLTPEEVKQDLTFPTIPSQTTSGSGVYSDLTGLELANEAEKTAQAYCIQTPNGTDGARPQAGLNEAGVVFEAIAEAGITRFAAIYQNPSSAVIGPIRSLRIYYLQWDTPFDCAIVHAGGADDAIAAVRSGGYEDLSENYAYMYRGTRGERLWNNLFTTSGYLEQVTSDWGWGGSNIKGFRRMTPAESLRDRVNKTAVSKLDITKGTDEDTSAFNAPVSDISLRFGGYASFNVDYHYNATTNSYERSYETGNAHDVYKCPAEDLGERNPEDVCELVQMSPSVVVAMVVNERKASDGYHEDITTVGSGKAYIFQNGMAIAGSWEKGSWEEQIKFFDEDGEEVALAPGQTFIEAIPAYGGVEY